MSSEARRKDVPLLPGKAPTSCDARRRAPATAAFSGFARTYVSPCCGSCVLGAPSSLPLRVLEPLWLEPLLFDPGLPELLRVFDALWAPLSEEGSAVGSCRWRLDITDEDASGFDRTNSLRWTLVGISAMRDELGLPLPLPWSERGFAFECDARGFLESGHAPQHVAIETAPACSPKNDPDLEESNGRINAS